MLGDIMQEISATNSFLAFGTTPFIPLFTNHKFIHRVAWSGAPLVFLSGATFAIGCVIHDFRHWWIISSEKARVKATLKEIRRKRKYVEHKYKKVKDLVEKENEGWAQIAALDESGEFRDHFERRQPSFNAQYERMVDMSEKFLRDYEEQERELERLLLRLDILLWQQFE